MALRLTPIQLRQIARMHDAGHSHTAIAAKLGVDRHTVARRLGQQAPQAVALQNASLTREDRIYLDALREVVLLGACPNPACVNPLVTLRHLAEAHGVCARCGEQWQVRPAELSRASGTTSQRNT